jgi:hypothetical protein
LRRRQRRGDTTNWARILAGEIARPGSFAPRSLSIVHDLTKRDAKPDQRNQLGRSFTIMTESIWFGILIGFVLSVVASIVANIFNERIQHFVLEKKFTLIERRKAREIQNYLTIKALIEHENEATPYFVYRATFVILLALLACTFMVSGSIFQLTHEQNPFSLGLLTKEARLKSDAMAAIFFHFAALFLAIVTARSLWHLQRLLSMFHNFDWYRNEFSKKWGEDALREAEAPPRKERALPDHS